MTARPGWVYLVGAGPGDPGLITRRGLDLLRACDVVLYDRLVAPALLGETRPDAERVFVGKKPGETHSRQVVSDALLVTRAREGKSVLRLKGGDPFVFGRGGEEALLLRSSDVPFEIVPGVSSAIAVPAYAGIPVTHRGASASFVVLTGREESGSEPGEALTVGAETVILLMGVAALARTAERLIAGGRDPHEPAASIASGTTGGQRIVTAELGTIAERVTAEGLSAPAVTIIGPVVALRDQLGWFEQRPLFGRSVVVTRPPHQAAELSDRLQSLGAEVVALPLVAIAEPETWSPMDAAIAQLAAGGFDWVLFASINAVEATAGRLARAGLDARAFAGCKIGVVGKATAAAVAGMGLRPDVVAEPSTAAVLASEIGKGPGTVLFPRVGDAPAEPMSILEDAGWSVHEVTAYRNVAGTPPESALARMRAGDIDIVTFASASAVERFEEVVGGTELLERCAVVSIGPSTTAAATAAGMRVAGTASRHDVDGLVEAILAVATDPR